MIPHQPDSGAQTERGFRSALHLAEAGRAEAALVALRGVLQVDPDHQRLLAHSGDSFDRIPSITP